jgi:hypothetical protein
MTIEDTELDEERHARRRAAVALGCLVAGAVVVVVVLVSVTGRTPRTASSTRALDVPVQTSSAAASSPAHARPSSSVSGTRPSAGRKRRQGAVAGDTGSLLQAFNAFRARHGVRPVSGMVTSAAIACAASEGDSSSCPSSYFWEPVTGADGTQVVDKISRHSDGTTWLLDPRIKSLEIGWKSAGGGTWECAVIATY